MWIKDPKTKKPSVTVTLLVVTFLVALGKILLAGVTVGSFTMAPFIGTDFAAMIAAVGGLYGFRKHTDRDKDDRE